MNRGNYDFKKGIKGTISLRTQDVYDYSLNLNLYNQRITVVISKINYGCLTEISVCESNE